MCPCVDPVYRKLFSAGLQSVLSMGLRYDKDYMLELKISFQISHFQKYNIPTGSVSCVGSLKIVLAVVSVWVKVKHLAIAEL